MLLHPEEMPLLLHPEEMPLHSERERTRLAAERYALLEAARHQRRQHRTAQAAQRRRRLPARLVQRVRSAGWLSRAGR